MSGIRGSRPGERRGGRKKGTPNKVSKALKDVILQALDDAHEDGSVGYLKKQAADNPTAFLTLVGKVLPMDVNANVGLAIGMPPITLSSD